MDEGQNHTHTNSSDSYRWLISYVWGSVLQVLPSILWQTSCVYIYPSSTSPEGLPFWGQSMPCSCQWQYSQIRIALRERESLKSTAVLQSSQLCIQMWPTTIYRKIPYDKKKMGLTLFISASSFNCFCSSKVINFIGKGKCWKKWLTLKRYLKILYMNSTSCTDSSFQHPPFQIQFWMSFDRNTQSQFLFLMLFNLRETSMFCGFFSNLLLSHVFISIVREGKQLRKKMHCPWIAWS